MSPSPASSVRSGLGDHPRDEVNQTPSAFSWLGCPLTWSFEYGFDPKLSEALAAVTGPAQGILLGRKTYKMFEEPWSSRTAEKRSGCIILQRHHQICRFRHTDRPDVAAFDGRLALRPRHDPGPEGGYRLRV